MGRGSLLLIVSDSNEPRYRRSRQAYKILLGIGVPTDILVMTHATVDSKAKVATSFVNQALIEGKLLYG